MYADSGSIDELRPFLNTSKDSNDSFVLAVSFTLAALRPRGPYPVLASPYYPGLEIASDLLVHAGFSTWEAGMIVVGAARVLMMLALFLWAMPDPLPPLAKMSLALASTIAVLLPHYRYCVRPTFVGAVLNGRSRISTE